MKKGATLPIRAADFPKCNRRKSLLLVRCIEISLKFINHSCALLQGEGKEWEEEEEEEDQEGKDTGIKLEGIAVLCQRNSDVSLGRRTGKIPRSRVCVCVRVCVIVVAQFCVN